MTREEAISVLKETIEILKKCNGGDCWYIPREAIEDAPTIEAETTIIRSRTLMPTKDFKKWAKRVKETNPNAVVIPCDAEVVSADAVSREESEVEE